MTPSTTVTPPAPVSAERAHLRTRMTLPQRHRLLHGYPLAAAMPTRRPGLDPDVRPGPARGLLVGVLPHPFCNPTVAGCGFCTFAHEPYHGGRAAAVVDHVAREVLIRLGRLSGFGRRVNALYFGGGTANLSPAEPFCRLCRTLAGSLDFRDAEVTLEGVPAYFVKRRPLLMDVIREEIPARHFRISMGIQTFDEVRRRQMGRQAFGDLPTFVEVVEAAHDRGFTVSADLLFNLPHQTLAEMRRDVDRADALGLDHLGLYHLVLFRGLGTEWSRDPDLIAGLPDNEAAAGHWLDLRDRLLCTGWAQTTLTNFERAAFWRDPRRFVYEEFSFRPDRYDALGFGPGGISFAADPDFGGGLKVLNPDGADAYAAAVDLGGPPWDRFFRYGPTDLRVFYLTRRLAALEIEREEYRRLFGTDVLADFGRELTAAAEEGLVEVTAAAVRPTPRGMFYADAVASLVARRRTEVLTIPVPAPAATARPADRADDNAYGHM
jgi:oxygen-independent coproporphyrinogen-3 oxidase